MGSVIQQERVQTLAYRMELNEANIESRKKIVGLEPSDLARIAIIRDFVIRHVEEYAVGFFEHLSRLEEARTLISSKALLERAKKLTRDHLVAMVGGDYGVKYAEQLLELASIFIEAQLDISIFLGAFHHLLNMIGVNILNQSRHDLLDEFMSLKKVAFMDISLATDALLTEREHVISKQAESIRELSMPVLPIRDRMLLCPIIGAVDTFRARLITENVLNAIRDIRAKVVVMDVTGVATIDTKVANHILQTVAAAQLMGAQVIVTGLSSEVAESLATLGIDLSKLNTVGDLQRGLERAENLLGYRVELENEQPSQTA